MFRDINWLEDCPSCGNKVLLVEDAQRHQVQQGSDVKCPSCHIAGTIEVFDKETVSVYWDNEDYN